MFIFLMLLGVVLSVSFLLFLISLPFVWKMVTVVEPTDGKKEPPFPIDEDDDILLCPNCNEIRQGVPGQPCPWCKTPIIAMEEFEDSWG